MPNWQVENMIEQQSILLDPGEDLDGSFDEFANDDHNSCGSNDEALDDCVSSASHSSEHKTEFNVLLLGESQCGKSALVARFMDKELFLENYSETIVDTHH